MKLTQLQRQLYLASRTAGDVNAAKRGRLVHHLITRRYHRALIRSLGRIWSPR